MSKNYKLERILRDSKELDDAALAELTMKVTGDLIEHEHPDAHEVISIQELLPKIERAHKMWGKLDGVGTGYPSLDKLIMGLKPGEVTLVAGQTSMGKSALAANISVNIAKRGEPVLFISLEMSPEELGSRMMFLNDGGIDDLYLMFQKQHDLTYKNFLPLLKRALLMTEGEVKLVVLDYLQYMGRGMDHDEMARISKSIKMAALDLNIPIMVITQIRKGASGKFKTKWTDIEIEDLMGTAAIGYDCDVALLVSRKDLQDEFVNDRVWVKILKNRSRGIDYEKNVAEFAWDRTKISEIDRL